MEETERKREKERDAKDENHGVRILWNFVSGKVVYESPSTREIFSKCTWGDSFLWRKSKLPSWFGSGRCRVVAGFFEIPRKLFCSFNFVSEFLYTAAGVYCSKIFRFEDPLTINYHARTECSVFPTSFPPLRNKRRVNISSTSLRVHFLNRSDETLPRYRGHLSKKMSMFCNYTIVQSGQGPLSQSIRSIYWSMIDRGHSCFRMANPSRASRQSDQAWFIPPTCYFRIIQLHRSILSPGVVSSRRADRWNALLRYLRDNVLFMNVEATIGGQIYQFTRTGAGLNLTEHRPEFLSPPCVFLMNRDSVIDRVERNATIFLKFCLPTVVTVRFIIYLCH